MKHYRKIWIENHGEIPKDEEGRSYEIHHIDGNKNNNDISNLKCVSIQEHYDIHYSQGDLAACHRIATKMKMSKDIVSELARQNALKMVKENRHPFQGGDLHRKLAKEGRHNAQIRSAEGKNLFQNPEWKRENALKLVSEGRHSSQTKEECPHCKTLFSITGYKRHMNKCEQNPNKTKNKYKTPEKKQCPHCLGTYDPGNYKQHHGDKCKQRGK